MYAQSQQYKVFEPNEEVKNKFYKFLRFCQDLLEDLDNNNIKYVVIIPYSTKLEYNTDSSRYEYSITYALINSVEPIKKGDIHDKSHVVFKKHTDSDFVDKIREALNLKDNQSGRILVSDYPLHEQLNRELAQEVKSQKVIISSLYTLVLYHHIVKTLRKGNQVDEAGLTKLCVDLLSNKKGFSRQQNDNISNIMICNKTAATIAGIRKNNAIATIKLTPEQLEAINIATGVPINGFNVVLTNTDHIVDALRYFTRKSYSSWNEIQNTRNYSSAAQTESKNKKEMEEINKICKSIIHKTAKIFFNNVPDKMDDFLNLFHSSFKDFIRYFQEFYRPSESELIKINETINKLRRIEKIIDATNDKKFSDDFNTILKELTPRAIERVIKDNQSSLNPPTQIGHIIINIEGTIWAHVKDLNKDKEKVTILTETVAIIILLSYVFVYYGASEYLTPKNTWDDYLKELRNKILTMGNTPLKEVVETNSRNTSTTSTENSSSNDTNSPTILYLFTKPQLADCHLYDRASAVNYCGILLNGDKDNHINEDPLKTIIDIMEYLSSYSNGIFSNINQIYKINEASKPHVPINFNKYDIENLMLLTCDQNVEAIPLLDIQARIDAEFVSNNVAVDIINNQFSPKSNKYYFNIIIFKRNELVIDEKMIEALNNLANDFGKMVQNKVEATGFVKKDVDISKILSKYEFKGSVILVDDEAPDDLEKTLKRLSEDCFNLVYIIDDHQYLHEMHISFEEIEEYTNKNVHYDNIKIPLTSYLSYVLQYTLHYRDPNKHQNLGYQNITRYRVLVNEMSIKMDYVRLLSYIHLLFNIPEIHYTDDNGKDEKIKVAEILKNIGQKAEQVRKVTFSSNKPYTVSLEPIKKFIENVKKETWYKRGFHRCNPNRKRVLEEYYEASASYYENFLKSEEYKKHAHKIINGCQKPGENVMSDRVGRVYVSILKPYEFEYLTKNSSTSGPYFEELNKVISYITYRIEKLYNSFSNKLKKHDTPEIDYNIETDVVSHASATKGKKTNKDKLKFLDELDLEYLERIAYVMTVYMTKKIHDIYNNNNNPKGNNQNNDYLTWLYTLAPIFSQKDMLKLLRELLPGFDEDSYNKASEFSKFFNLTSTELILMILTNRYLNYLYSNKDQDIGQAFREIVKDIITTTASEASVYKIQMLIAGIKMFLQNFICDLYSNSGGRDFMDANRFSGRYLVICEDSDLAAALASSISILLRFKGKTDRSLKEIETLARQFYSNVFKTLYKKNNKWYKRVIHNIISKKKNEYYNEELGIIDKTLTILGEALNKADDFIILKGKFDKNYPLYGLAALSFVLAIPMTLSLAMSLGDRDNTNSMQGLVYKYQDTMSAYGITLSNRYCSAGYGIGELEWPEDTKMSQLIDFPVSTNIVKPENIFDRDNYNEAIVTISEVLSHRAKNMEENLGQVIITDDYTRLAIDMNNINTIIILSGRRSTLLQGQIQNTRILSEKVAWELYDQTNRKANVYYVAFEYDDRIQHIINDTYLKENLEHSITYARLGLNQSINNLYSVMSQVQAVQTGTAKRSRSKKQQAPQFEPIVLTIAIT
jgi:hypothetical protein